MKYVVLNMQLGKFLCASPSNIRNQNVKTIFYVKICRERARFQWRSPKLIKLCKLALNELDNLCTENLIGFNIIKQPSAQAAKSYFAIIILYAAY